ncbi:malic enzyme [Bartonella henselae]|uniref:Malic enzyme n=6 Tax=Bartonella TaxID=773 RepID=X5M2Y8_BARHN|nr:NADP-dependent malic enzyme [Bartonella henselae]MDM9996433.1 NADP-dependent malic enzyme [Bartonella henselae]OLL47584.1 malic enzyme [Bartonella henselae]OLL50176.1 malic enzyme [Bartonella henselae]OLL50647.1 malic enzyme [Bartonella henselae]OLL56365.1 malic enzyme [Bartonella henselae]
MKKNEQDQKTHQTVYNISEREALDFHSRGRPGKLEIVATKSMATQYDLALAYSPGVAVPVKAIAQNPELAYDYTTKGNLVAVISNGTAILGLGNLGALASKPVMEGKAVLFKRFADIDSIDLEIDTNDPENFINLVRHLEPSFGGINLEDIKAPECFMIESRLREVMNIPVFHDDQHGTAIIVAAGVLNALYLTGRDMENTRLVCNGAGSAGIACIELIKAMGFRSENIILCDTKGVVYEGRKEGMNQWKSVHAVRTDKRTLAEAMEGADVFFGVSAKGAITPEMVKSMAPRPIIFAMANPDPEITPEEVMQVRKDAIIATGRSDYPNQINNVLCFPYIFRGALDVRATVINEDMKIAAARAIADLAHEEVPDSVAEAYRGKRLKFGPNYIIPVPFDPRLFTVVSIAVAKAAMKSGVAQRHIDDLEAYERDLNARRDPISSMMRGVYNHVRQAPKQIVFAEGEEEQVMRAAVSYVHQKLGQAILIGREEQVRENAAIAGIDLEREGISVMNAKLSCRLDAYANYLYKKMQRQGWLLRDCHRRINNDRNYFAACMVALGDADAMVTGVTRNYETALIDIRRVIDEKPRERLIGISMAICRGRTVFIADTAVYENPNAEEFAHIAEQTASFVRGLGYQPRVAFVAFSTFGYMKGQVTRHIQDAVNILRERRADFEFDGEISADVALNVKLMQQYPFMGLTEPANILVMPGYHASSIASKMLQELGEATIIGPILIGLERSVQIVPFSGSDTDVVNIATLAAYHAEKL